MKMIPPTIDQTTNIGEKKVFTKLRDDPNPKTKNWVVYHSLKYPVTIEKRNRKSFKYFGEADFVILIPNKGIINVEVKGWKKFSCENGVWEITERDGNRKRLNKSPLRQASDQMYEIRKYIEKRINKKFPQAWMIVFTQCPFDKVDDSIEFSEMNIVDTDGLNTNFSNRLMELSNILKAGGGAFQINDQDMKKLITKIMRPNFELYEKTSTILKDSKNQICEFTAEQIKVLDYLDDHPRLLISGSQGTGKSAMAEEILGREIQKKGQRILFLNSNRLANEEMKFKLYNDENAKDDFWCFTFNGFLKQIYYYASGLIYNPGEEDETLKNLNFIDQHNLMIKTICNFLKDKKALKDLKEAFGSDLKYSTQHDIIVFDEMQNCFFYDGFYELLDLNLKGGLANGRYCFFGDFKYQSLVTAGSAIKNETLESRKPENHLLDYRSQTLFNNVRNTKDISLHAPILSGMFKKFPYIPAKTEGGEIHNFFLNSREEKISKLVEIIKKLHEKKIDGNNIVILSNFKLSNKNNFLSDTNITDYYQVIDLTTVRDLNKKLPELKKQKNSIYFSTAAGFQGLESEIVIYIDPLEQNISPFSESFISEKNEMLAFNAMGRANTILYLLWNKEYEKFYQERMKILGSLVAKTNG